MVQLTTHKKLKTEEYQGLKIDIDYNVDTYGAFYDWQVFAPGENQPIISGREQLNQYNDINKSGLVTQIKKQIDMEGISTLPPSGTGEDFKTLVDKDWLEGSSESHLGGWFNSQYKGRSKENIRMLLGTHDDSREKEVVQEELGRQLNSDEEQDLIERFHKTVIDNIEFVNGEATGYWDTSEELNTE